MTPALGRFPPFALWSSLPRVKVHYAVYLLLAGLVACSDQPGQNPVEEAFAASSNTMTAGTAVAFRFPASGGLVRLYRLPNLEEVTWRFDLGPRRPVQMIGFASDNDIIYALAERDDDEAFDLIALDLAAGRGRTIDSSVTAAAIGPTGIAYVFRPDGTVGQIEHRTTDIWPVTLENSSNAVWGAARGRLLTILESDNSRELVLLARDTTVRQPLPSGELAVSEWARLVAVAVDSGLITQDPMDPAATRFLEITPRPRLLAFSTSGHQIYLVKGDQDLVVVDRFQNMVGDSLRLPGRVTELRVGPLGRRLLAYSSEAGTVWVVDLIRVTIEAALPASWEHDLPAIAADGTILLRRDGALVAYAGDDIQEAGVSNEGDGDLWLVAQWDPRRPGLELARDSTRSTDETRRTIYVQISSSHNAAWAQAMAEELNRAGMPTTVLPADSIDGFFRVVMGPYSTREEAETSARRLNRPFFIRDLHNPIP